MISKKAWDRIYERLLTVPSLIVVSVFISMFAFLIYRSIPILESKSLGHLLLSSRWNPDRGSFGLYPMIVGTIMVTVIAMMIAVPISIFSAIYISEYAPRRLKSTIKSIIDVLAGIPSVVYGMCAILVLVPLVSDHVGPFFGVDTTGYTVLTAGITLSVMIFPIIISMCVEAFQSVPLTLREASLTLGATKWETVKYVVFRKASPSVYSSILLGFGRAFGETMAVAMVIGNLPFVPRSVFSPATTIPAVIATTYGEMMSLPLFDSAIMFSALLLLIIVVIFNILAKVVIMKYSR